ncbi:MAG: hypothetical protein PHD76_12250 [Methylacidiphilales bacterium]|nr:hypothetical protein [Candidatus Methylacidiphilales bacterium]
MNSLPDGSFKDQKTLLTVFGALEIAGGAICLLFVPLMLLGQVAARYSPHTPVYPMKMMIAPIFLYLLLGAGAIWLGVGSILAKRWARALLLILGWMGLVMGVFSALFFILGFGAMKSLMMESMSQAQAQSGSKVQIPEAMIYFILGFSALFSFFIYVVIPGALVLVYRGKDVKRTCETRNPAPSWTDACPLPVLALVLLNACALFSLPWIACYSFIIPIFGVIFHGAAGAAIWAFITVVALALACGLYRLQKWAWAGTLLIYAFFGLSGVVTFHRIDFSEMYRLMGMPDALIPHSLDLFFKSPAYTAMLGFGFLVWIGYVLWVRKYFFGKSAE